MISQKQKQTVKLIVSIAILILLFLFVLIMMIKYEVEGESNMPFILSKIVIVGTVEGTETQSTNDTKWNFDINQNNDVYFYIDKNENNTSEELIKSVKISNIQVTNSPQKGIIKVYMPNSEAGRLYTYDDQFLVDEKLEYRGGSTSSSTNLEIGSQGGTALIRFSNTEIGNYASNKDKQIIHNSTLLKKIDTTNEEIKFSISCDLIIETTKNTYKSTINLDMPTGNLDDEENCYLEKTNISDITFKRIK